MKKQTIIYANKIEPVLKKGRFSGKFSVFENNNRNHLWACISTGEIVITSLKELLK